jgi:Ca2+-binding EF-hand superfamily protein
VGGHISEEVWEKIIKEVDENGDGEVSFDEFKTMMQ